MANYPYEEVADMAVKEIRAFIDADKHIIQEEHELSSKLWAMDLIFEGIAERIPDQENILHDLNESFRETILALRKAIMKFNNSQVHIVKEEAALLEKIEDDIEHKEWKIVKVEIDESTELADEVVRLREKELKEVHSILNKFDSELTSRDVKKAVNGMEGHKKIEEYFSHVHAFIRSHEKIFKNLYKKEKILSNKLEDTSDDMD